MKTNKDGIQAEDVISAIRPRVTRAMPGTVRGILMADGGWNIEVLVLSSALGSQRQQLRLDRQPRIAVFVDNFVSLERAVMSGHNPLLVRLLAEGMIVEAEESRPLAQLQARAIGALSKPRPVAGAEYVASYSEPIQLLGELEQHARDHDVAQLVYSDLLCALLRARMVAERAWMVGTSRLLDECRMVDPALAAWVAGAAGKSFTVEMLPALRVRVKSVIARFAVDGDAIAAPRFGVEDMMVGYARQVAAGERQSALAASA